MAHGGAHEVKGFTTQAAGEGSVLSENLSKAQGLPVGMVPQEPAGGI